MAKKNKNRTIACGKLWHSKGRIIDGVFVVLATGVQCGVGSWVFGGMVQYATEGNN